MRAIRDHAYAGLREAHLLAFGAPHAPEVHDVRTLSHAAAAVGLARDGAARTGGLDGGTAAAAAASSSAGATSSIAACFSRAAASAAAGGGAAGVATGASAGMAPVAASSAAAPAVAQGGTASRVSRGEAPSQSSNSAHKEVIEISDGDTEEDEVEEVPAPAAKRARGPE